jgi:hypothetical protein
MINLESHIELMLQYGRTHCLIWMLHYGRAFSVRFTSKLYPFTIRNAIREGFCYLLNNVIYCITPDS